MNLLILDTSTLHSAVALGLDDGQSLIVHPEPGPKHGRLLVPAIRDLLDRAGLQPRDLDAVAVAIGPGSFTGLRVGVTAAKTLAFAIGCPIVPLSTLEILAHNAPSDALWVVSALDAQRGDLFSASFRRETPGGPLLRASPDQIIPADAWTSDLPTGAFVLCPTPDRIAAEIPDHATIAPPERARPLGGVLLDLATRAIANGDQADLWTLEPRYLRRSAAEEKRDALHP
ncbi:tRNA (adenosine(37)-N6)-threonylcarbamoyltransferase complex dimerization subunit type 1 TsaB [Tautonia marina]|uniref:tRNA (adenosine(37)-N6)-threonylcarbamoyltransferase complex dimerization subunit type 1 TsaB n=1 Tax=Tautonia marina TaxID=2653855 RepID=UPI0013756487|nr:tRNA (adenosine(37)-N6)-threonylcarbamoyltransferase complex dimerization subunit type 1 TsaB [Tautonia marina]